MYNSKKEKAHEGISFVFGIPKVWDLYSNSVFSPFLDQFIHQLEKEQLKKLKAQVSL